MRGDSRKIQEVRAELVEMVSAGQLESACQLLDETVGPPESRGWGFPHAASIDLMRRIMAIRAGAEGVELAVDALCGKPTHGPNGNVWKQARYEQDIDSWRQSTFSAGVRWEALEWSCRAGKRKAGCYKLSDAPPFETPNCDFRERESQCCCGWHLIFAGVKPPSRWRK